jgi:hypothetical protein
MNELLRWGDDQFRFLVASERHGHGMVDDLLAGRSVECGFIGVSDEQASGASPWGSDRWRGGLAGIGRLTIVAE